MTKAQRYNGWRNRETWLGNIWFNPESRADLEHAEQVIEEAIEKCPDFLQDFIYASEIDWHELRSHVDDAEAEAEGER